MTDSGLRAVYLDRRDLIERVIRARTNSADEAQDVMQELWIRVGQVRPGPIKDPVAYLLRMAMNLVIDRSISTERSRKREAAWTALQPTSSEFPNQEGEMLASDELARVHQLLGQMPETMAKALILFRIEGQSQKVIAAALGMSVSGVEKLLSRAYRQLTDFQRGPPASTPASLADRISRSEPDGR